jgi:hypothetical protein
MKLILCLRCSDVVALASRRRYCLCGHAWGRYETDRQAVVGGTAVPLAILSSSLQTAVAQRGAHRSEDQGIPIEAYVISENSPYVRNL